MLSAMTTPYPFEGIKLFDFDEEFQKRERQKAKELKKSRWWQNLIQKTRCYYCQIDIFRDQVTMDHVVPISRGGLSRPGNIVAACKRCNEMKRSLTPVEWQEFLSNQLEVARTHEPGNQG